MKKVLIFGGSGFIGKEIVDYFCSQINKGYSITLIERKTKILSGNFKVLSITKVNLDKEINEADIIINFSGANIITKPWTKKRKKEIWDSRILTTERISQALINKQNFIFINASAIGYYGFGEDAKTEKSPVGNGFLSELCQAWEDKMPKNDNKSSFSHDFPSNNSNSLRNSRRSVSLRLGLVLGKNGGAFHSIILSTKLFLATIVGGGEQWVSWIYVKEIPRVIEFIIENPKLIGAVNLTTPNQITFKKLIKKLAKKLNRPVFFKIPSFFVKLIFGKRAPLVLESSLVKPEKLINFHYRFKYPDLDTTLDDIFSKGMLK